MGMVYVREQGATIRKTGLRILVEKDHRLIEELLIIDMNSLILVGNIQITSPALKLLMDNGINVFLVSVHGRIYGHVASGFNKNIFLRLAQYQCFTEKRMDLAKSFLQGKFQNQKIVVERSNWGDLLQRRDFKENLERAHVELDAATALSVLYGIEGSIAKSYFELFSTGIKHMEFTKRKKRPAYDPVNAMLNFGYSLLIAEITSRLEFSGFELGLGFLHQIHYGRASLACDLIEEFRAPVIDRLVVSLINNRRFKTEDFKVTAQGCLFKNEVLPNFMQYYEEQVLNYRKQLDTQVIRLKQAVLEGGDYKPWNCEGII